MTSRSSRGRADKACALILAIAVYVAQPEPVSALATPPLRRPQRRDAPSDKSKKWIELRQSGVKSRPGKKAPKWEKEGDSLYHAVVAQADGGGAGAFGSVSKATSMDEARELLSQMHGERKVRRKESGERKLEEGTQQDQPPPKKKGYEKGQKKKGEPNKSLPPPHMIWGELSVGPVLRQSLLSASLPEPTEIQSAAFPVISSGKNAVVASPTGTGKSLAFLLPLLASAKVGRNVPCSMVVVTPTVELAAQLQREVDRLWPPKDSDDGTPRSAMHLVGFVSGDRNKSEEENAGDAEDEAEGDRFRLLSELKGDPILAGTPRSLRTILREARRALENDSGADGDVKEAALCIQRNMKAVVLDEADRLLRTEGKARDVAEAKQRREQGVAPLSNTQKKQLKAKRKPKTQTEQLFRELPVPVETLQVVCASATVGRTLRRQLMDLLGTASLDKTAELITGEGDIRTGKNADRRKSSLVPDTLHHIYRLIPGIDKSIGDDGLGVTVAALRDTLQRLDPPSPALIFPGKLGVDSVQKELYDCGVKNVLGLRDIQLCKEGPASSWEDAQCFVVGDKFGRGLDIPGVKYVFLLSPPSSAAGYTHLSGRTGRNGEDGTAITFTRPREAHKLVAIAEALGLAFEEMRSDVGGITEKTLDTGSESINDGVSQVYPWALLSETSIKRKTVADLKEYLNAYGSLPSGKVLKADLLEAVYDLHK